ncbi:MAG TPA: aryl-sulfate sulfotransferase [Chitinophagales bacterium]|nr:aryl-sulfate sulfotransferase [Chitinophagales bacterium]
MKNYSSYSRIFLFTVALFSLTEIANGQFLYLNPLPDSKHHNPEITLAIRNGAFIDESSVHRNDWIEITGSKSGAHTWTARLSDDRKTVVVKPQPVFDYGETVSVIINSKLKKQSGQRINGQSFSFQIRDAITPEQEKINRQIDRELYRNESAFDSAQDLTTRDLDLDSLPTYTISTNNNAAPGQIFYNNQDDLDPENTNCFNTIIENDGTVVYAKDMGLGGHDFKINYNGYLTYFNFESYYWMVMDSNYNIIDSFRAGNGYPLTTNPHDCSMYPDGHTLLLVENHETMDMTPYGGLPDATVTGVIIQELDANKDVVWEWSGWDHFQITDAGSHVVLTNAIVDYVHSNAVLRDDDGNVLLSSRHFSELTKIDRNTGDIIWRLGGENNQFTFVNDNIPQHFSYQHDTRRIANGNITLFNNGNYLPTPRSSAKEYELDEVNKVATLVWYYEHPDVNGHTVFGPASGSVQRLPDGNTIISWGTNSVQTDRPAMTEVDSAKNITWEMKFDEYGQKAYRAHKYVWDPCAPVTADQVKVKKITTTSAKVYWTPVKNAISYNIQFRKLGNSIWRLKNTTHAVVQISRLLANTSYEYRLRTSCANGYLSDWTPVDTFTTHPAKFLTAENDNAPAFQIYPNPASDLLTMTFALDQDRQIAVCIYDVAGRLMLTDAQIFPAGEQELKMNISALPAGYYLAQVSTGSVNQTMKFVKE